MEEYVWISKANRIGVFTAHAHPILYRLGLEWNVEVTIAGSRNLEDGPFIQAIYDAIDRKVAGIMLHGWGVKEEIAAINTAVERGIPVVTVDSDVPNSKRLAHVGTDWFRMGSAMADQLVSLVGENGKMLFMGNVYLANIQAGFRGFQYRMSTYPHVELFGPEDDSGMGYEASVAGPYVAEAITIEWLQRHPDIGGVAGFDFHAGRGIASALEKMGLAGKVKVVCVDAEEPHIEYIEKGTIQAAFSQRRELFTYQAFQMLYAFNHGSASTGYQPGPINISGNVDTGFIIVTKGNADSFEDEFNLNEAFERQALTRRLALMSTVIQSTGQMILAADTEWHVVYANPASLRLTSMAEEQIIGAHINQIFNFTEKNRTLIEQSIATETPVTFETTARREHEGTFPVQLTVSAMKTDVIDRGLTLIAADITDRKRAEEALQESEARWQFALEGAGDGVWDWNTQTNEVFFSPQWKAMLGYEEHEIESTLDEWDKRVHPEDKDNTYAALNDHLAGKTPVYVTEHRMLCKDGTYKWILDRGKVIGRTEDGKPQRIIGTHSDITDRKWAEVALRQSEARYRALVESQIDMISRYRPDTTLTFVNDAYCRFYGKTREELIGQSYLMMVAPEFHEQAMKETQNMLKDPRPILGEYLNYAADGKARWIQWVLQGIVDENGQVVELQGVGRDITRIMEAEAALRESELFLQKSQTVGRVGSYYLDISADKWIDSPMLDEIFGIDNRFPKNVEGWIALVHPDQRDEMLHYLNEHVFAKHNRFDKEYRILRHDNQEERWVHGLGELEFDELGNPLTMIGTIQDITERKQIEETLLDSESRFSVIFNESADLQALSSVEPDGAFRLVAVNDRYLEAVKHNYGVSRQDIIGKPLLEFLRDILGFDEKVCNYTLDSYHLAAKSGGIIRYEETLDAPLGSVYTETIIVPIFASSNQCRYILYSARDISERKQAEAKIHQLNEELEQRVIARTQELQEANEEIRQFAYIVSHDLRAPLVNLKGFAAELRSSLKVIIDGCDEIFPLVGPAIQDKMQRALQEDIPEALRFIESSVSSMDSFTKAILKLSRLGRLHLEPIEVDVRSLVENTLHALAYEIHQRGITITIGDLPVVAADLVSMEQIFGNILANAVAYLDPNRPGKIEISAEQKADETVFRIRDNGQGIAKEDMDKVFAPFRRAGKQDVPGEGMGLAYVQTLVRRHGGRIWCESEAGVGTMFTFTIARNLRNDTAGS